MVEVLVGLFVEVLVGVFVEVIMDRYSVRGL